MTTNNLHEPTAVIETRLAHGVHRVASNLLTEAAVRPSVPLDALEQLRDFLVANLRHHHETEDHDLWPRIIAAAPAISHELDELSGEHEQLDEALDRLSAVLVSDGTASDEVRVILHEAARAVRDTVHSHLTHEEPILFPALLDHISPQEWQDFSQRVIATTPPVAGHLMIGFLDEVGTPAEVELMLSALPEQVLPLIPAMRRQAAEDLRVLRGGVS